MLVVVGRVARAHGVRGEFGVEVRTDEPDLRFARGRTLRVGDATLTVRSARRHGGRMLLRVDEITDRDAAARLAGSLLEADVDDARVPSEDETYYDHQLVGMAVWVGDRRVGTVEEVRHGAQDLLVVRTARGEALVPFVAVLVPRVDVDAGYLEVADRPGLLYPTEAEEAR